MLLVGSALMDYAVIVADGKIGTVSDFLFDDTNWKIRWLVVDTGTWLSGRKILVHPSAISEVDHRSREVPLTLSKAQVKDSPEIEFDKPVSRQVENSLYDYYGWNPSWGGGSYGFGAIASPISAPPYFGSPFSPEKLPSAASIEHADPHLRSLNAVTGYHVEASDGDIGHVENFIIDEEGWVIRYLIVDTRNWWFGQHVLISPYSVSALRYADRHFSVKITRDQVKKSPVWDPAEVVNRAYEQSLHTHYSWPGHGW